MASWPLIALADHIKAEKLLAQDYAYCAALRELAKTTRAIEKRREDIEKQLAELRITRG